MQTIARTKDNIVKKQALTYEEMEAEREEVSENLCFSSFPTVEEKLDQE